LAETIEAAMGVAYLKGFAQSRKITRAEVKSARPEAMQLSTVFDKSLKSLANTAGVSAKDLQKRYKRPAFIVAKDAAGVVEVALQDTVADLIAEGAHVKEGIQVLRERFAHLGVSEVADYRLEAIFRTQTQLAYSAGRWDADQDPAVQEILWGYEYSTVGDDRVRPEHEELDGVKMPKDSPFWDTHWPPNGWNCRCIAIPLYDEQREVPPPGDVQPDKDFDFNAGQIDGPLAPTEEPKLKEPEERPTAKPGSLAEKGQSAADLRDAIDDRAKEYGVRSEDVKEAYTELHTHETDRVRELQASYNNIHTGTHLTTSDVNRLNDAGFDYAADPNRLRDELGNTKETERIVQSLAQFDERATVLARDNPLLELGSPDDPGANISGNLWDALSHEKPLLPGRVDFGLLDNAAEWVQSATGGVDIADVTDTTDAFLSDVPF
jgi:SPP1 gp7 family putative phage head morphogenesis protein